MKEIQQVKDSRKIPIPIGEKYMLTVNEAFAYFLYWNQKHEEDGGGQQRSFCHYDGQPLPHCTHKV